MDNAEIDVLQIFNVTYVICQPETIENNFFHNFQKIFLLNFSSLPHMNVDDRIINEIMNETYIFKMETCKMFKAVAIFLSGICYVFPRDYLQLIYKLNYLFSFFLL